MSTKTTDDLDNDDDIRISTVSTSAQNSLSEVTRNSSEETQSERNTPQRPTIYEFMRA